MSSIFTRIINREIPATIVYEDEFVIAFNDINPLAPIHILIVPKKEIPTVNDVTAEDEPMLGHLFSAAARIASDKNIAQSGYRLIMNCNADGGQEVFHLHLHLLGGEKIGPMRAAKG
jgi:histidine triad (HIT) family protein